MTDFTEYWNNIDKNKSLDQVYTEACRKFPNELVDYAMLIRFDYKKKQLAKEDFIIVLKKDTNIIQDITDRTIKMIDNLYPNKEDQPIKRGRGRPRTRPIKEKPAKIGRPRKGENGDRLWDETHRKEYLKQYYKDKKDEYLERQRKNRTIKKLNK